VNGSGIIAFVSLEEHLRIPSLLSRLASAISALDGQVARVGEPAGEIRLQSRTGEFDHVLVDVPFKRSPSVGAVLSGCDLIIVACSCKLDYIDAAKDIVKELLFLGITPDKTAALLVDPAGMLPGAALDELRGYLENSLGVEMAGGISLNTEDGETSRDFLELADYIMDRARRIKEALTISVPAEINL